MLKITKKRNIGVLLISLLCVITLSINAYASYDDYIEETDQPKGIYNGFYFSL